MALADVSFLQNLTYSAEVTRRTVTSGLLKRGASIGSSVGGLVGSTDFSVTYGGTGLGVSAATGEAYVPGSQSTVQGAYYTRASSTTALTPSAASPSYPRIDLVYLQVQDATYSGTNNQAVCALATGTPTAGATLSNLSGAPSLPSNGLALAYVLIPANATTISNADILNVSAQAEMQLGATLTSFLTPVSKSANYTLNAFEFSQATGTNTQTVPVTAGVVTAVQNAGSGTITVAPASGYINNSGNWNASSITLTTQGQTVLLEGDGTNVNVIGTAGGAPGTTVESYISSAVTLSSTAYTNITSVSLEAGTWFITGRALIGYTAASSNYVDLFLGPTSASKTSAYASASAQIDDAAGGQQFSSMTVIKSETFASTTTVYLEGYSQGTATAEYNSQYAGIGNITGITAVRTA